MNLLNQRTGNTSAFGPRNLLNSAGQNDMEGDIFGGGNLFNTRVPAEYPHSPTLYSNADFDSGMPVFRPGEVSSASEKPVPPPDAPASTAAPQAAPGPLDRIKSAVADLKDQYDGAGRREEGIQELPPNINVGGQDNWGYSKLALARDNNAAAADIALKQYPGATVRQDQWGNPIIKLPDGATRTESTMVGMSYDGFPISEQKQVPISGEFYLNKPGFSQRDAANFAAEKAFTGAGGVLGEAAGGPMGGIEGAALGSEVMDALAQQAGSQQGIDGSDMLGAAAGKAKWAVAKSLLEQAMRRAPPD